MIIHYIVLVKRNTLLYLQTENNQIISYGFDRFGKIGFTRGSIESFTALLITEEIKLFLTAINFK